MKITAKLLGNGRAACFPPNGVETIVQVPIPKGTNVSYTACRPACMNGKILLESNINYILKFYLII
jgi:hypothetical protein